MRDQTDEQAADQPDADVTDVTQAVADLEPLGGDPPCWAHLFEDDDEQTPGTGQSGER